MKSDRFFSALTGGDERLTQEQTDALHAWCDPCSNPLCCGVATNPWHFLTGVWPLELKYTPGRSEAREPKPIVWVMDPIEKRERPFPSEGFEYIREAILHPIFVVDWPTEHCTIIAIKKSRKVLGTLGAVGGCFTEILDLGELLGRPRTIVQWQFLKQNYDESVQVIGERARYIYGTGPGDKLVHRHFPAFLRRRRPTRPKPVGKLVFGGVNSLYAVKQNFSASKGGSTDAVIDECVELRALRGIVEAARPQTRRLVLIATPPEPDRPRQDPDSVQFFREVCGDIKVQETRVLAVSTDPADTEALRTARMIGSVN